MRSKLMCLAVGTLVVLGACGGGKKPSTAQPVSSAGATVAPGGTTSVEGGAVVGGTPAAAGKTAAPKASAAAAAGAATAKPAGGGAVNAAPPGGANIPKAGNYLYVSSGSAQGATDPQPRTYENRETTIQYSDPKPVEGGTEITAKSGTEQGSQTTTNRWEKTRVLLLSIKIVSPQGNIECKYNTSSGGLEILRFPIKAEKFPQQSWSNESCSGTHDQEILGQEDVTAAGKTWKAWKVKIHDVQKFTIASGPGGVPATFDATIDRTILLIPDLGVEGKSDGTTDGSGGGQSFKSSNKSELKSYP
jgi:hypothetical protein